MKNILLQKEKKKSNSTAQLNNHIYFQTISLSYVNPTCILLFTIKVDFILYSVENFEVKLTVITK